MLLLCAEESCHIIQQNDFFLKNFPTFSAHDGELWCLFVRFCMQIFTVAHSLVVSQSLKSGKDLKRTQIMGSPSGYSSLFD